MVLQLMAASARSHDDFRMEAILRWHSPPTQRGRRWMQRFPKEIYASSDVISARSAAARLVDGTDSAAVRDGLPKRCA
jgi:hypothetical protein